MEMKQVTAQGLPYEAWKDNEYIEKLVSELQASGTNGRVSARRRSAGKSPAPRPVRPTS